MSYDCGATRVHTAIGSGDQRRSPKYPTVQRPIPQLLNARGTRRKVHQLASQGYAASLPMLSGARLSAIPQSAGASSEHGKVGNCSPKPASPLAKPEEFPVVYKDTNGVEERISLGRCHFAVPGIEALNHQIGSQYVEPKRKQLQPAEVAATSTTHAIGLTGVHVPAAYLEELFQILHPLEEFVYSCDVA